MKKSVKKRTKEEKLLNVPNALSILRIILTFLIVLLIFMEAQVGIILAIFIVAALTDFFDGQIARRFNQKTEFGRKADMIADRFLWVGTALAYVITLGINGKLDFVYGIQFLFMLTREILCAPFVLYAFLKKKPIPHAILIAKATTFMQRFAIPLLIISLFYRDLIYLTFPLCLVIAITGAISASKYIKEILSYK